MYVRREVFPVVRRSISAKAMSYSGHNVVGQSDREDADTDGRMTYAANTNDFIGHAVVSVERTLMGAKPRDHPTSLTCRPPL